MIDTIIRLSSALVLSALLPLAILISRDRLRFHRQGVLIALEEWMSKNATTPPLPSFEVARIKYDLAPRGEHQSGNSNTKGRLQIPTRGSWLTFLLPAAIYSVLTGLGFLTAIFLAADTKFWSVPNFILSGMQTNPQDLTVYQWNSGAAITAGFLGAYLFTLQYLVQRVRNYELSPTSFLVASVSILEACFIVGIARHFMFTAAPNAAFTTLAFVRGYFPTLGIAWLAEHLKFRDLKRTEKTAFDQRFVMPTDMIDGVDTLIKFRLMEAGVYDVQNLATANPVLLFVETPFNLMTILDWIAQAQLIIALGPNVAANLRGIGVRTGFNITSMQKDEMTRQLVLEMVWPRLQELNKSGPTTELQYDVLVRKVTGSLHARRLQRFWTVMISLVDPDRLDLARDVDRRTATLNQQIWQNVKDWASKSGAPATDSHQGDLPNKRDGHTPAPDPSSETIVAKVTETVATHKTTAIADPVT